MKNDNPTTVRLNESVKKIKDELSPVYGLKNILSAGLLLFSRLSADSQKKIVIEVNSLPSPEKDAAEIVDGAVADATKRPRKRNRAPAKSA